MDSLSYKTISANAATVTKEWVVIDATNEVLGRLASQVAKILRGKNKPSYTPHVDCGDYVIVINAEKVKLTGNKMTDKVYTRHTGYPGGQRFATPADYLAKKPTFLIEKESGFGETAQGVTVPGKIEKMGYKGVDTTELVFQGHKTSTAQILGGVPGKGFYQMMDGVEVGE